LEDFLIDMGVSALLRVAADPKRASKWRRALLKVFRAIAAAFPSDPEFKAVTGDFGTKRQ